MNTRGQQNRRILVLLIVVTMLHSALLMIPSVREQVVRPLQETLLRVDLKRPPPVQIPTPETEVQTETIESAPAKIAERPEPAKQPVVVQQHVQPEPGVADTPINLEQLISRQFLMEESEREAYLEKLDANVPRADYFVRARPSLDDALNMPVVHLPFRDTRIYEVAYYEEGFGGAVDKFFDTVAVPFGFTTKGNTRVQCVWMLIVAGCVWDNKARFYRAASKRTDDTNLPF